MTKFEKSSKARLNQERHGGSAQEPERRLVVYFIAENRAIRVGRNQMSMPPAAKRTLDLHIFECVWRIVCRVFGDPTDLPWTKDNGFNYCL